MLICKICGKEVNHDLCTHVRNSHKLNKQKYLELFPESIMYSDEFLSNRRKMISDRWNNPDFIKKQKLSRQNMYNEEWSKKVSDGVKAAYEEGRIITWNKGKTKENDVRLKSIGEKNKKHLTGRTKDEYEYLQIHSTKMKKYGIFSTEKNPTLNYSEEEKQVWKDKISNTISEKIKNGNWAVSSGSKHGWYESVSGEKFWYQSKLECDSMCLLDKYFKNNNLRWTNKHGIKIQYTLGGNTHNYIPDFLIDFGGNNIILIEMKGYIQVDKKDEVSAKQNAAKESFEYYLVFSVKELETIINTLISKFGSTGA